MNRDEMMRHEVFRRLVAAELPASAEDVGAVVDQVRDNARAYMLKQARFLDEQAFGSYRARAAVYYALAQEIRQGGA